MNNTRQLLGNDLGLEQFRHYAKYDPWSFWGWDCDCNCGKSGCSKCQAKLAGYYWQKNRVSRDDIAEAISMAEDFAWQLTKIPVGRKFFEETVRLPRNYDGKNRYVTQANSVCMHPALQLCNNYVQQLGVPKHELLGTADVVYEDRQGNDPWADPNAPTCPVKFRATLQLTSPVSLDEIQAHFATGDRVNADVDNNSYIRPVTVTLDGSSGDVVVCGPAWMMGNPQNWELGNTCPSCLDKSAYVQQIELYRHYVCCGTTLEDACALLLTEGRPCGCGCCCNDPVCGKTASPTCGGVRIGKSGLVYVTGAVHNGEKWAANCCKCCDNADSVCIRYVAGLDHKAACNGNYARLIAMLAIGLLPQICTGCCVDSSYFRHWAADLAEKDSGLESKFNFTFDDLNNPWGTTRGAIQAYKQISTMRVGRAVVI